MAIVKDYWRGPTHIMIDDRYCRDQTREEKKEILDRCAQIAYPYLLKQHMEKLKQDSAEHTEEHKENEEETEYSVSGMNPGNGITTKKRTGN